MGWSAPRGHDDHVTALALCVHAARQLRPAPFLAIIPGRDPYVDRSRF